ncbi:MAG TPA: tetratricopeptide repeat protein [Xanthobacteraceae bacterium]|nr:tetratricopeptide repeat protein [Xanthobacteraceae bacterium]
MIFRVLATALLLALASATLRAAEPAPLPPAVGLSESADKERAALFAALAVAKSDAEAREIEERLWTFWRSLADDESRRLLEQSREAQLRFDYAEALLYNREVVKHAPQFAEGWNQLGYVYFLAGQYDGSLAAIEHVLALEPMHYAALAGKGIILYYAVKVEEAQAPLKRALAINPWLKERNLIGKDSLPTP